MEIGFERDDSGIRVHERGVIAQLCSLFRSHEQGLPEWFKNASTAYARENLPTDHRLLTLLVGNRPGGERYIALLDHAGMSVEDLEQRFANWGDPEAHLSVSTTEEPLEGGHGNGGKCYMTQMFSRYSYLHTVRNGRGSCYGFKAEDPHPGYFPSKIVARGFPVARAADELKRALAEIGVEFSRLPTEIKTVAALRQGFTLVVGVGPKQFTGRDAGRKLFESIAHHPQMVLTTQKNSIFVMIDGKPLPGFSPFALPEIEPHEYAPDPRVILVPHDLNDPVTGEQCPTAITGIPQGKLILRTSKVSMRWSHKGRHHIRYMASGRPVAFLKMENVSRSTWVDKMYGECHLDILAGYETPDRSVLAEAPLTRALESWIREKISEYEDEFKRRDHLSATNEQRKKLQDLNDLLDRWKNRFLEEAGFGAEGVGGGEGERPKPPRPRPLPQLKATKVSIIAPFSMAGVGVWLRMRVDFTDSHGIRVAAPSYAWYSSDWAVATVDENRVVTHMPGEVDLWVETMDGRLRSNPIRISVLDIVTSRIEPADTTIAAGQVQQLTAVVTDRSGKEQSNVFMTWLQEDSSIVHVTPSGKIVAQKQGKTKVYAVDERCINDPLACDISVTPAEVLAGGKDGRAYPKILLSEVDEDPLNPDGETVRLSPEDGPVHQPTPQHVQHNIWWINLQCPLAKLYFEAGSESPQWRSYHIERYIEVLVKIRLSLDFQVSEEELSFDEIERRWREIAAEVQRRALTDLRPLLEGRENSV